MKIELQQYNEEWPTLFERECAFLLDIIGRWLVGSVEHVGSTAVKGMVAKPVIDIMFGVQDLESSRGAIAVLQQNGYCYYPYKPDVMHWFCKPTPEFRTHHVHLIPFQSSLWFERITFRDALRQSPAIAEAYIELKLSLASDVGYDREAYTQQKWPFIQKVLSGVDIR